MRTLSRRDMEDLLIGAELMGCGGGGLKEWGEELIEEAFSKGKEFKIENAKKIPVESLIIIVSRIGGGVSEEMRKRVKGLKRIPERTELVAARELARYLNEKPYAFLPSEIGAGNTIIPMYVASMTDRITVDADACGRAKPELSISTTSLQRIRVTPLVVVTPFGETVILDNVLDDYRAEDICRQIAVVSGGVSGMARCPTRAGKMREAIVHNSISQCIKLGRRVREARESGKDPVQAFLEVTSGVKIFEGRVRRWQRDEKGGFMWGTIIIDGAGYYKGHILKIWFKNEFLISWLDDKPYVMCPDLLCVLDAKTARGLSNWVDLRDYLGVDVVVAGVRAADMWRTSRGIEIFGPKHFGYDIEYKPLEEVVGGST